MTKQPYYVFEFQFIYSFPFSFSFYFLANFHHHAAIGIATSTPAVSRLTKRGTAWRRKRDRGPGQMGYDMANVSIELQTDCMRTNPTKMYEEIEFRAHRAKMVRNVANEKRNQWTKKNV